jgi:hypothetical protein
MANKKISELPLKLNPGTDDFLPIVDTTVSPIVTKRTTVGSLIELLDAATIGPTGPVGPVGPVGPPGTTIKQFTVTYTGTSPSSVSNLPAGWSAVIASNDVTITHTVGTPVVNVVYWGYSTALGVWRVRYPSAANEATVPELTKNSTFTLRISNTVVGTDSGGTARIVCFF